MSTRTIIKAEHERRVTITYTCSWSDERITLEIWAPMPKEGGYSYVRYNGDHQLCDRLAGGGSTLTYKDGTQLIDLVRREYRAMRAAERRRAERERRF